MGVSQMMYINSQDTDDCSAFQLNDYGEGGGFKNVPMPLGNRASDLPPCPPPPLADTPSMMK